MFTKIDYNCLIMFTFVIFLGLVLAHDHPHGLEAAQQAVEPARRVHPRHRHPRHAVRHLEHRNCQIICYYRICIKGIDNLPTKMYTKIKCILWISDSLNNKTKEYMTVFCIAYLYTFH